MRLFIAFDIPSEEIERLRKLFSIEGVTLAKGNHLTLKFLGEVDETLVPKIQEALRSVRFEKIDVRLDDLGVFPNKNLIRVVWVGLEPEEKIIALKKKIDVRLDDLGVFPNKNLIRVVWVGLEPEEKIIALKKKIDEALLRYFPEDKDFKVHVTIGRVKDPSVKDVVLEKLKERVVPEKIELDCFNLYRSGLGKSGLAYTVLEEYYHAN